MTSGKVNFHLSIRLPLWEVVQVILQDLAILGGFHIPIQHTIISNKSCRTTAQLDCDWLGYVHVYEFCEGRVGVG